MSWILPHFPPHKIFVDVFGGGGGITFAKPPSEVNIYNDKGRVAMFFKVMQDHGDRVYKRLYFTPYSREFFYHACDLEEYLFEHAQETGNAEVWIDWAANWYVSLSQSFRKEEDDDSWFVAKEVNAAQNFASHVDDFPRIIDLLRTKLHIENLDFRDLIPLYDTPETLFVLDPPYVPETWEAEKGGYRNIMSVEDHIEMIDIAQKTKGQVIICGYPSHLYDSRLTQEKGWRRVEKTRKGGIKNSSQKAGDRTECLWMRVYHEQLWSGADETKTSAYVSRIHDKASVFKNFTAFRERNTL